MASTPTVDAAPAGAGRSLKARAARGTALTVGGQLVSQTLRLGSNLILTRLLFPEAFGLMAIVNLVMNGLGMISNVGIHPAIVRHERGDDPAFLNTGWTMGSIRGVLLWLISCVLAIPVARLYEQPELVWMLPVAGFSTVLSGLAAAKMITLKRHIVLEYAVAIEVAGQVSGLIAMIAIAYVYRSVWALVAGGLVMVSVRVILSHLVVPGPPTRFQWEPQAARDIFSFGKWIFVSTLLTFLSMRMDVALLGKLLPLDKLGVYSVGIILAAIVRDLFARVIQSVLMPALAASHREGGDALLRNFRTARGIVLPVGMLAVCGTSALAPAFFEGLYDDRYHEAGWIAQLSMLMLWVSMLQESSGRALLALGESRGWAIANFARTIGIFVGCVVGFQTAGLAGLMVGAAAGGLCGYVAVAWMLAGHGLPVVGLDLKYSLAAAALGLTTALAPGLLAEHFQLESKAGIAIGLAIVIYGPIAAWIARQLVTQLRR